MNDIVTTDVITTRSGYARLQERLQNALNAYDSVCETNAHAAGDGDTSVWHDNFAYEHNQREMHKWARRISDLEKLLVAVRIGEPPMSPVKVGLGCVVVLRDAAENKEWRYEVAGYGDGDVSQWRVSYTAPLMKGIIGGEIGDKYELFLDDKNRMVVISAIQRAE